MNLKEIANKEGVSVAAVSLVLNGKKGVSAQTRTRVAQALVNNGYTIAEPARTDEPEKNIRFLKYYRNSFLIDGNASFISTIIDAVEAEAHARGYGLMMSVMNDDNMKEIVEMARADPKDGIIILGTEMEVEKLAAFKNFPVPIVVVDNYVDLIPFSCVDMDNWVSLFQAVGHLVNLGHSDIGFLYNAIPSCNCSARYVAFKEALQQYGVPFHEENIFHIHPTLEGAYGSMNKVLEEKRKIPAALVCTNDIIALGAVKALKEHGYRVPEDVSIIGFDDIPFSAISDPPLTTIRVSCRDMGIWTVDLLCKCMADPKAPPAKIQVGTTLVTRNSTKAIEA